MYRCMCVCININIYIYIYIYIHILLDDLHGALGVRRLQAGHDSLVQGAPNNT